MPNPNRNLDKEITEGLARSERMIRRQRMIKWMVVLIALVVILMILCCGGIGLWWAWKNF